MNEEQVTKAVLQWLIDRQWSVVSFDFPQSGTGRLLHPNGQSGGRNKDAIIPDIVAVKDGVCIFIENKDRFYRPDYEKQNKLMVGGDYSDAIKALLRGYAVERIFYGVGLPKAKHKDGSKESAYLVDFILCVDEDRSVTAVYDPKQIPF